MRRPADRTDAPRPEASPDLIFGILALRVCFIGGGALRDALDAWVGGPGTAGDFPQFLAGREGIAPGQRDALWGLTREFLGRFGGAEGALAALGLPDELAAPRDEPTPPMAVAPRAGAASAPPTIGNPPAGAEGRFGWRYRPLRLIGSGGAGDVYAAFDRELNREVALKAIRGPLADEPLIRARFQMEAEITAGLEHSGVPAVYDLGHTREGHPFYAMRLVRGETLRAAIARFRESPPADDEARRVSLAGLISPLLAACRVAAYAHGRGVLHRDLKPGNILVTPHGESLVVDWGIAKMLDRHDPGLPPVRPSAPGAVGETILHRAMGTPHYMSPEQAAGDSGRLGPPTDVYGLGATLYEILAGRPPFDDIEEHDAILDAVRRGGPRPPGSLAPGAPPALEATCLKAMAPRPEDRHPSPAALADDLWRWLVGGSPAPE